MDTIRIAQPMLGEAETAEVLAVLRSGRLAAGERVRQFEDEFAKMVGARHAIATSSGTTALQAALRALELEPGALVITTPFSFIATANAILDAGLTPLFVDIEPDTFNVSPEALAEALREHPNVRAVLAVHLFGLPFSREIPALCRQYGIPLVEDAAQAHGAMLDGRMVGSLGQVAAFSFYATKNMTTGEGGMVTTSDPQIAERVRLLVNHGQRARYQHERLGFNYRMTELQAAIGVPQLRALPERNERRRRLADYYHRTLPAELCKPVEPPGYYHVYHQYTLRHSDRDRLQCTLARQGIEAVVYYPRLIPQQPAYASARYVAEPCPEAERAAREVISIPVHPGVTDEQAQRIVRAIAQACEGSGCDA